MRLLTCHSGKLQALITQQLGAAAPTSTFATGLQPLDQLAPGGRLARGAVHELLSDPRGEDPPLFCAAIFARAAAADDQRAIVWLDAHTDLYPPALADAGIHLDRLLLLRPDNQADACWAIAECLRCKGVGAVVAQLGSLSQIQARRLQLAAEDGGAAGILLRPADARSSCYAAATRWRVQHSPGRRTVQRWMIQLVAGHGGRIGQNVFLERCRETNHVRAIAELADRSTAPQAEPLRIGA